MKQPHPPLPNLLALLALTLLLPGCELVGDLLEFGFWVIVIIVLLIVALIWWIGRRLGSSRREPPPPPPPPPPSQP